MAKRFNLVIYIALALLLAACSSPLPKSGGKPYDVAIVSGTQTEGAVIMRELSQCTENFTTEEGMFNLSLNTGYGEDDIIRLARTLVIVDTADIKNTVAVRELNVWAHPQLVLYITTPSAKQLAKDMRYLRPLMAKEINAFERSLLVEDIMGHSNMRLTDTLARYTGVEMCVPAKMKVAETDSDFVWFTENNSDENQSLCVYRTHKDSVDITSMESVTAFRDSMMHRYIRGAADSMRYRIVPGTQMAETYGDTILVRNKWEMTGDAMGGPSVCRILERNDSVIFAEAFIYAPASQKRNKMRRAEACLFTIKTNK